MHLGPLLAQESLGTGSSTAKRDTPDGWQGLLSSRAPETTSGA